MKIYIKTFGCRTNIYDSELIKAHIKENEVVEDESLANAVLINSCTVTNKADKALLSYINKLKKENKKIILTGCAALSLGKDLVEKKQIDALLPPAKKRNLDALLKNKNPSYEKPNLSFVEKPILKLFARHTKAFVKIQEGCDYNCSYCIIPFVRGRARSLKEEDLIKQINTLVQNGHQEIVLTGTNIGSYGKDIKSSLAKLLEKLSLIKGLKRVRLGSLEPAQIDERFLDILSEDFIERHLHIALQHTSETMLRIMRRRSHSKDDLALFLRLKDKGFALGSDFIVAHPGESEQLFNEGLSNFKNFGLTHLHAFIYSPRKGTRSALMPQNIAKAVAKERLHILKKLTKENNLAFRKSVKVPLKVLVESKKDEYFLGYDQFFNKIKIKSNKDISNSWQEIRLYKCLKDSNTAIL